MKPLTSEEWGFLKEALISGETVVGAIERLDLNAQAARAKIRSEGGVDEVCGSEKKRRRAMRYARHEALLASYRPKIQQLFDRDYTIEQISVEMGKSGAPVGIRSENAIARVCTDHIASRKS